MARQQRQLTSATGKKYRLETTGIGTGPVQAVEVAVWAPKRIGRDRLLYVDYPVATARAQSGPTDKELHEFERLIGQLVTRIETEAEETWAMDREALLRASNLTVATLIREFEAINEPVFVGDPDALSYIGQGEKLAVHRAGIAPERRA